MSAQPRYAKEVNDERTLAPFISLSSHCSENTLVLRGGELLRVWKVNGIAFETEDPETIAMRKEQLNTLLRSIGSSRVALWLHQVHRKTKDRLPGVFTNEFARRVNDNYYRSFDGYRMMSNGYYLAVIYRPNPTRIDRMVNRRSKRDMPAMARIREDAMARLDEIAMQVEAGLKRYDIEPMTTYQDEEGALCSQPLELYNFILTGRWQKVRLPRAPLYDYLGNAQVFVGLETCEIRGLNFRRFVQGIAFKDYADHTEPGILNGLMYEPFEFVVTQSFSFLDKRAGKTFLETQRDRLQNSEDGSPTQIEEMNDAIDQLVAGNFCMGEYHYSLAVYGDSMEEVKLNRAHAASVIEDRGFLASTTSIATDAMYYAQLPGNWNDRPRVATLTSRNFAGFCSFHNFVPGKRDGNPWGPAVTLTKTPSGQPLYLNFHFANSNEDAYGKKLLGNTRIIGQSGSGKTSMINFFQCQVQKFRVDASRGFLSIFFDYKRGAELTIRLLKGKYLVMRNGQPTGMNPWKMEPTEANIVFLQMLTGLLALRGGSSLTISDEEKISRAVRTVMKMPRELRSLTTITQNMTEGAERGERENSVVRRLLPWTWGQPNGWVLDCPDDLIDFGTHDVYGFDGTQFLDNPSVRTPISLYLLHRMQLALDGRRLVYWMDEFWKWVDDPACGPFVGQTQLTIRSKDGLGVLSTQMPSSMLESKIAKHLVQQTATEIYLPNLKADRKEYIDEFKLTPTEFEIVRSFGEDSRLFLMKQGHRSMIGKLDLSSLGDDLAILSPGEDDMELFDEIVKEVGEDPEAWLPLYHERRKAAKDKSKRSAS